MATVYLIPSLLQEEGLEAIPSYVLDAIKECKVFFVENERTTRRYFKRLWKEMIIDDYEWVNMSDTSGVSDTFKRKLKENKTIGIISEAGCPGVADPGQSLVDIAHQMDVEVKPLVGPNSILLALMASGMNGQQFQFHGYLPIDNQQRVKAIKDLEVFIKMQQKTAANDIYKAHLLFALERMKAPEQAKPGIHKEIPPGAPIGCGEVLSFSAGR